MRDKLRAIIEALIDKDKDLARLIYLNDLPIDIKEHYRGQRVGVEYAIDLINKYLENLQ